MVKASIYFILTAATLLAVFIFGFNGHAILALWVGSVLILVMNILSFAYINGAIDKRPAIIIRRYMATMTIKLLLSVGLLVWYMMQPDKIKGIAVFLVILYFVLLMLNGVLTMTQVKGKWGEDSG